MLKGQEIDIAKALLIAVVGLTVVIAVLAVIAVFILVLSKILVFAEKTFGKNKTADAEATAVAASAGTPLPETESQGELKLTGVDEPTAAVIMAIVSNQSGIPLNRLDFKSIKLIEEK